MKQGGIFQVRIYFIFWYVYSYNNALSPIFKENFVVPDDVIHFEESLIADDNKVLNKRDITWFSTLDGTFFKGCRISQIFIGSCK